MIDPYSHDWIHHPHPLHFSSSMIIVLFSVDWKRAFFGQAVTHGAFSHFRQANAILDIVSRRIAFIRDLVGLYVASFYMEQTYSQTTHPLHFLGSQ